MIPDLTMYSRLASSSQSSCTKLPSTGIKDKNHYNQPTLLSLFLDLYLVKFFWSVRLGLRNQCPNKCDLLFSILHTVKNDTLTPIFHESIQQEWHTHLSSMNLHSKSNTLTSIFHELIKLLKKVLPFLWKWFYFFLILTTEEKILFSSIQNFINASNVLPTAKTNTHFNISKAVYKIFYTTKLFKTTSRHFAL